MIVLIECMKTPELHDEHAAYWAAMAERAQSPHDRAYWEEGAKQHRMRAARLRAGEKPFQD